MFGRNGLTDDERCRLKEFRQLVDAGLVGGELDGDLTMDEYHWLTFWALLQVRHGTDVASELDPERSRALQVGIMERIKRDG